jgi:hypothetical protein
VAGDTEYLRRYEQLKNSLLMKNFSGNFSFHSFVDSAKNLFCQKEYTLHSEETFIGRLYIESWEAVLQKEMASSIGSFFNIILLLIQ